ncbi:MAG: hypothetical protein KAX57_02660 [Rhodoferax sp.]|uniref:hypothetical protein n=1 Tax=Rhodoferax sp. TaxID=50421 RepID=UPI001B6118B1|nr:hypothetical protein [Rhodoferax sp.]MBP8285720.1 hypothetical protein [Rhodoferax sp.]MBP9734720.1 hypothetical protein [Rhodoferax sp.]
MNEIVGDSDVLILTILPEENSAVISELKNHCQANRVLPTHEFPNLYEWHKFILPTSTGDLTVATGVVARAGNDTMQAAVTDGLQRFNPIVLLVVGVAGGLPKDSDPMHAGDVVIGDSVWSVDRGKIKDDGLYSRPSSEIGGNGLLSGMQNRSNWQKGWNAGLMNSNNQPFQIITGGIAASNYVITVTDHELMREIVKVSGNAVRAVEMESWGAAVSVSAYATSSGRNVTLGIVRGLSDIVRPKVLMPTDSSTEDTSQANSAERDKWKQGAANNAARFVVTWLTHAWPFAPKSVPAPSARFEVLSDTMAKLTTENTSRWKYSSQMDVRKTIEWPVKKPVIVIAGRSGDGKTWGLAKLVVNLGNRQEVAVLVRAAATTEATLARAAQLVWQDGLGETSETNLSALSTRYKEIKPGAEMPWLTVAVDDVRDLGFLKDLIDRPWERWGMRLVITAPSSAVKELKNDLPAGVAIHEVTKFSVDEVDALLQKHGQKWADLPRDLQALLRMPILAGLYTALAHESFQHAPHSEYEIFDRFWQRMVDRTIQGDAGIVTALASRVIDEKSYPLKRTQWGEAALSEDSFSRLDSVGWLQCDETGSASLAHDRLLNWAAAKEVVLRYRTKDWTLAQLTAFLQKYAQPQWPNNSKRLDYLPMDTLWMLLDGCTDLSEGVTLLESFEQEQTYGSYASELYQHLLPTLGMRVVPLLLARLDKLGSRNETDYQASLIADAMTAVARHESVDLAGDAAKLIGSSSETKQNVGIALLSIAPVLGLLDRLWELHLERCERLDNSESRWKYSDYESSHAALKAGVKQNPEWLRKRIINLNSGTVRVSELGYLLNSLDHPSAPQIWLETKGMLFTHMPKDRRRSLIYCIGRFNATSEVGFLVDCLSQQVDSMGGAALASIVKLDPDLALRHLGDDVGGDFVRYRSWWLPDLMHVRPTETRKRLLEIAKQSEEGRRFIEQLFQGRANELDIPLLDFLLDSFTERLRRNLQATCTGDAIWITFPLRLFNEISRSELLAFVVDKSNGELENMLVQVACSRIGHSGRSHDHALEEARTFLILLSSSGITELINAELRSPDYWGRYRGLKCAMIRPDATTLNLLGAIARTAVTCDADGTQSNPMQENYSAMRVLASSQADDLLVDAIWTSGSPYFSVDLADMRGVIEPMTTVTTKRAADTLADFQNAGDDDFCCALITAWVSADPAFIAPIRATLAKISPSSLMAVYACVALQQLGDESDEFAQFANQLLSSTERCIAGINALCSLKGKGISYLMSYLESVPVKAWRDLEIRVVRHLALFDPSHDFAVEKASQYCIVVHGALNPPYDIAAEAVDTQLRELVRDKAFEVNSVSASRTYFAIKGLAKFDSNRATEAVLRHLKSSSHYEREQCVLLTNVDPKSAVTLLFDLAAAVERDSLVSAVGRALRRLEPTDVDIALERACKSANRRRRSVAAELAGWLPADRLTVQLALLYQTETENEVRTAIFAAHTRRRNEVAVIELFDAFKVCPEDKRWALLLSILQLGDPILLNDPDDKLWIGTVLESVPFKYRHFVKQEIDLKIEKLKQ